jgi:hypothetical protein
MDRSRARFCACRGRCSEYAQHVLENGFVNLVAVVGFLILAISIIPAVLYLGTPKLGAPKSGTDSSRK